MLRLFLIVCLLWIGHAHSANVRDPFFRAVGDGVTDDHYSIQRVIEWPAERGDEVFFPLGSYLMSRLLCPVPNSRLILSGESLENTELRTAKGMVAVYSGSQIGNYRTVGYVEVKSLTFTGNARDGMRSVIFLRGRKMKTRCVVKNCKFRNTEKSIIWLEGVWGVVEFVENYSVGSRSLNIVNSRNVIVSNNTILFNKDDAITISRDCRQVAISDNTISESVTNSVFVGAIFLRNRNDDSLLRLELGGFGDSVIRGSGVLRFSHDSISSFYTLYYEDEQRVNVQVLELVDPYFVKTVCEFWNIPVDGLSDSKTSDFTEGPYLAPENVVIKGNVIEGIYNREIALAQGPRNVSVVSNVISHSGSRALLLPDFQFRFMVSTRRDECRVILEEDLPKFIVHLSKENKAFILFLATDVQEPNFLQHTDSSKSQVELESPLAASYLNCYCHILVFHPEGNLPFGDCVFINEWQLSEEYFEYAEQIVIIGNMLSGFSRYGIVLGSSGGAIRDVSATDKLVRCHKYSYAFPGQYSFFLNIGEIKNRMLVSGIQIDNNIFLGYDSERIGLCRFDGIDGVEVNTVAKASNTIYKL